MPPMHPGDLLGFETEGMFASIIKFGQHRFGHLLAWKVTHIAIVEEILPGGDAHIIHDARSARAELVQAVRTIDRVRLSAYGRTPYVVLSFPGADDHRDDVVAYAQEMVGLDYGILTVVSDAANYLTPPFVGISMERQGHMCCSIFGARAWEHGGVVFDKTVDVARITPGSLTDMVTLGKGITHRKG